MRICTQQGVPKCASHRYNRCRENKVELDFLKIDSPRHIEGVAGIEERQRENRTQDCCEETNPLSKRKRANQNDHKEEQEWLSRNLHLYRDLK